MGSRRWWIGFASSALVVLVVIAAWSRPTPAQTPAPTKISMFGDSVLLGAREELLAEFNGQDATVDAAEDRSLLGAIGLFQNAGPALGDVVVLDLGYNDAADPTVFRERIDGAMSALAGVRHVIWLNQHDWGPGRAAMNGELVAAAARYPALDVVDWNAEVVAHPDYVYADAIHLTPAGQTAMAHVVRQHFDRYVTSLTPTTTTAPATTTTTVATTRAPLTSAVPAGQAAAATDDDDGFDVPTLGVVVAAVLVLVVVVAAAIVTARARRRRRVSAGGRDRPGATPDR